LDSIESILAFNAGQVLSEACTTVPLMTKVGVP